MPDNSQSFEYAQLKSELSAVRGDISNLDALVSRLDVAIDKISDVSTNINRLLAVHDNKLETHSRMIDQLTTAAEYRRTESDKRSQEILDKINQIREDVRTSIHSSSKEINDRFDTKIDKIGEDIEELKTRVTAVERWKWMLIGAAPVVGFIISKLGWVISLM